MKKVLRLLSVAVLSVVIGSRAAAEQKNPWFHLEVKENKAEPEYVKVNLPLSMMDVALNIVKDKEFKGHFRLPTDEVSLADLRKIWADLKKVGNAEFVTVQRKNETVRIGKEGKYVTVKVAESQGKKVSIKASVQVVDALLAGTGDEVDLKGALLALQKQEAGEILTVDDNQTQVRIWVD